MSETCCYWLCLWVSFSAHLWFQKSCSKCLKPGSKKKKASWWKRPFPIKTVGRQNDQIPPCFGKGPPKGSPLGRFSPHAILAVRRGRTGWPSWAPCKTNWIPPCQKWPNMPDQCYALKTLLKGQRFPLPLSWWVPRSSRIRSRLPEHPGDEVWYPQGYLSPLDHTQRSFSTPKRNTARWHQPFWWLWTSTKGWICLCAAARPSAAASPAQGLPAPLALWQGCLECCPFSWTVTGAKEQPGH